MLPESNGEAGCGVAGLRDCLAGGCRDAGRRGGETGELGRGAEPGLGQAFGFCTRFRYQASSFASLAWMVLLHCLAAVGSMVPDWVRARV